MATTTASRPRNARMVAEKGSRDEHSPDNGSASNLKKPADDGPAWEDLARALAKRRASHAISRRLGANPPCLSWGWPTGAAGEEPDVLRRIRALAAWEEGRQTAGDVSPSEALASWLAEKNIDVTSPEAAIEALAWAHALPALSANLEPAAWRAALDKLLRTAQKGAPAPGKNLLAAALISAELPATLAYWFPELPACAALAAPGRESALRCLETATDASGIIHASYLPWLRALLASWTRLATMEEVQKRANPSLAGFGAQPRFQKGVVHALHLARSDGAQALSPSAPEQSASTASLFRAALKFAGEPARRVAALAMPKALETKPKSAAKAKIASRKTPSPAFNSELSQLAVLRTGWGTADSRLTVAYDNQRLRAELACGREVVASGDWQPKVEWNGTALEPISEWEEVCWVSDDDVDYLELEISLSGGLRIQRHLLLAREDRFLFAADAVLGEQPGQISYRSTLPLAAGARYLPAKESHEGQLAASRVCGLALPLALAEWRSAERRGELSATGGALELRQSAVKARAMFAPLFIDLAPRRLSQPFTWRRLTVAENRQILPDDLAVGYRVQAGSQQWLFYRSLGERGNRTLLGHNLVSEFLTARISRKGIAESLLEIEG